MLLLFFSSSGAAGSGNSNFFVRIEDAAPDWAETTIEEA